MRQRHTLEGQAGHSKSSFQEQLNIISFQTCQSRASQAKVRVRPAQRMLWGADREPQSTDRRACAGSLPKLTYFEVLCFDRHPSQLGFMSPCPHTALQPSLPPQRGRCTSQDVCSMSGMLMQQPVHALCFQCSISKSLVVHLRWSRCCSSGLFEQAYLRAGFH